MATVFIAVAIFLAGKKRCEHPAPSRLDGALERSPPTLQSYPRFQRQQAFLLLRGFCLCLLHVRREALQLP